MAGQIVKRGEKSWTVRIFLGRDAKGKRKYFNKTIRGTKKDAQKYLNAKLREKDLGVFVEPSNVPLSDFLDKWLETCAKPRVSEATYTSYEINIRVHIKPALGSIKLCDLQLFNVQKFYNEMSEKGSSPRTVRYVHSILSMVIKQAIDWDLLIRNPCRSASLPKQVKKEIRVFSREEAKRYIEATKQDPLGIILEFALNTGMRPEEYLSLQWSDIDFDQGTATVQRALVWRQGGGWTFRPPKTKSSRRTIPLALPLLSRLRNHKVRQAEHRLKLGPAYESHNLVFATELGTPIYYGNLDKRHHRLALKNAGLSLDFRLYDLRHTCATLLLADGVNVKVVAERLGHASVKMTLETYTHVLPGMQEGATNQMSKMLYG